MEDTGDHWLHVRPAETIETGHLTIQRFGSGDLDELVAAVNDSLGQLRPWMPWAQQPATPGSIGAFLEQAHLDWNTGRAFGFAMRDGGGALPDGIIGACGLHARVGMGALEIGYWVRTDRTGQGVATAAARALTGAALDLSGVGRVEIRCDEANVRSASIPAKLGFQLDRIERRTPDAPGETDRHMIWVLAAAPTRSAPG